jgi:hypothetical protein
VTSRGQRGRLNNNNLLVRGRVRLNQVARFTWKNSILSAGDLKVIDLFAHDLPSKRIELSVLNVVSATKPMMLSTRVPPLVPKQGRSTRMSTTARGRGTNPSRLPTMSLWSLNARPCFVCAKSYANDNVYER